MKTVVEDIPDGTETEKHRYLCGRVKSIFDAVFGEGTGVKVCGVKDDLLVCMKAYDELVSEQTRQDNEYLKIMQSLLKKVRHRAETGIEQEGMQDEHFNRVLSGIMIVDGVECLIHSDFRTVLKCNEIIERESDFSEAC